MEAIVKSRHREAHTLIDGFLQRHLDRHGAYTGDLYKYLCTDFAREQIKTRQALVDILLEVLTWNTDDREKMVKI